MKSTPLIRIPKFRFRDLSVKERGTLFQPRPFIQLSKLNQSTTASDSDGFCPTGNIQLGEDVAQVPFHCGFADVEIRTDFLVALAACQQSQRRQFPSGQGFATHYCRQLLSKILRYASRTAV